jgi:hypothetical protein
VSELLQEGAQPAAPLSEADSAAAAAAAPQTAAATDEVQRKREEIEVRASVLNADSCGLLRPFCLLPRKMCALLRSAPS